MRDDGDRAPDDPPRPSQPSDAEVRAQLERILASECFAQATRSSRFLRYVVDETLAGRGDRLKGYTLAVEVFDRPADFDAQTDPLVRVEAGRVRRRLIEYYARYGRQDRVVLELPRGSYVVACSYALASGSAAEEAPAPASAAVVPERPWWRSRGARAAGAAVIALAIVVTSRELLVPRAAQDEPNAALMRGGSATVTVVAFTALDGDERSRTLGATLTEEVLLELDEHELFVTAVEPADQSVRTVGAPADPARYVLSGSVRSTPERVRITARLVAASTGEQLWTAAFDEPPDIDALPADQTRVARNIAAVAAPYGPVFKAESARVASVPAADLRTSDCVLKYYEYRSTPSPALHEGVLRCFERAATVAPELANSWAGLALLLIDVFSFSYGAEATPPAAALERAGEAARTAMDIDGGSLLANLALARVQFFGDGAFQGAAERALTLCPNNIEALQLLGTLFVLSGEGERGLAMVERAIALAPDAPGSYHAVSALGKIQQRDYAGALESALKIDAPDWHLGHLVLAATAGLAGREAIAARSVARLLELYPAIERELPGVLERFRVAPGLRGEVLRGLSAAGLPIA